METGASDSPLDAAIEEDDPFAGSDFGDFGEETDALGAPAVAKPAAEIPVVNAEGEIVDPISTAPAATAGATAPPSSAPAPSAPAASTPNPDLGKTIGEVEAEKAMTAAEAEEATVDLPQEDPPIAPTAGAPAAQSAEPVLLSEAAIEAADLSPEEVAVGNAERQALAEQEARETERMGATAEEVANAPVPTG
jgi:hypothetical protein